MARKPPPERQEIAASTRGRDVTRSFVSALGNLLPEDPLLAARGADLALYEEVMRDAQVKAVLQQRKLSVIAREFAVEPGGPGPRDAEAAAHLEAQLKAVNFDAASEKMLNGVFYGFAVSELMWGMGEDRLVRIDAIKVRRQRRFVFGEDGALRLRTLAAPQGEAMPARKFWSFSCGAEHDDDPYGRGLAYWLYWPVFFKRGGLRYWAKFLEKFGAPTASGTYPRAASREDQGKLLDALRALQEGAAIVMPEGMQAALIEASRTTSDHAAFIDLLNGEISKIVLSQTMTTDDGASRAQAVVHFDVREEVAKSDADLLCESFNRGPAQWLTEWNFPGAAYPRVFRDFEEPEDAGASAVRDLKIAELGFAPSEAYIQETYGPHWTRNAPPEIPAVGARNTSGRPDTAFGGNPRPSEPSNALNRARQGGGSPGSAFAEPEAAPAGDAIDAAVAEMLAEWEPLTAPLKAQVEAVFAAATSYEDLVGRLMALVPSLDVAGLTETLARGAFSARMGAEAGETLGPDDER